MSRPQSSWIAGLRDEPISKRWPFSLLAVDRQPDRRFFMWGFTQIFFFWGFTWKMMSLHWLVVKDSQTSQCGSFIYTYRAVVMKVNTPYIIPKDPDMSQQMDLTLQSYFGDGMFRTSILRFFGKGLGILGASYQKSNTLPKFNMEPENKSLEKESPFGNHYFQVPC